MNERPKGWNTAKLYVNETGSELPKGAKAPTLTVVPKPEAPAEAAPQSGAAKEEAASVPEDHCSFTYVTGAIQMIEQHIQAAGGMQVEEKKNRLRAIRERYINGPEVNATDTRNGLKGLEAIEAAQRVLRS